LCYNLVEPSPAWRFADIYVFRLIFDFLLVNLLLVRSRQA